jgi:RNA polymerase sigma factor (sigma-70 family)
MRGRLAEGPKYFRNLFFLVGINGEEGESHHVELKRVEKLLLPYADAAYNLARWLTRNDQDARDVVQEAYIKAFRFIGDLKNPDPKAWLLQIVRNTAFTWMEKNRNRFPVVPLDEETLAEPSPSPSPEEWVLKQGNVATVRTALEKLAPEYREVLVLREMEEMTYEEISQIAGVPMGTVMSRLSRGRAKLLKIFEKEGRP